MLTNIGLTLSSFAWFPSFSHSINLEYVRNGLNLPNFRCMSWIGLSSDDPQHIHDYFVQFVYSTSGFKALRSFLRLIWLSCACVLCNKRNN